jgi:hypothetical protein
MGFDVESHGTPADDAQGDSDDRAPIGNHYQPSLTPENVATPY